MFLAAGLTLRAERLPLKAYTTADGLPNDEVDRIVADSRGFVWLCTRGGLARFEGYSFTNFSAQQGLPEGGVNDLLETRSGEYWVGTDDGLIRFDPKGLPGRGVVDERHATKPMFARVASKDPDDDRFAKTITVLRQSHDGVVWVGTRKGLYRLENTPEAYALRGVDIGLPRDTTGQREIVDIREDRFGTLWIVAPSGLYRRWPDGTTASYRTSESVPAGGLSSIYEDRAGRFWVTTREAGFFGFTADSSHSPPTVGKIFSIRDGLPNVWVNQLLETSDGRFWVADGQGLVEFFPAGDAQGLYFHVYGQRNGLTHYFIHSLEEDLAGNLWLGSNAGAMKLARDGFTTYGRLDGIGNVNAIFEDRAGEVCFRGYVVGDRLGTVFEGRTLDLLGPDPMLFTRLGCFDGQRFDWFDLAAVTRWGWVLEGTTLQARTGEFWVGTEQGVLRFAATDRLGDIRHAQPRAVYRMSDGDPQTQVARLFEDSAGNIWIATTSSTTNGVARWESHTERVVDLARSPGLPPLNETAIFSFGEDASGNVWTGFSSGLARYSHGVFRSFGAPEGLPPGTIRDIHRDHAGRLWLGSERAGLIRVDDANSDRPAFVSYATAQGLSSDYVQAIVEDSRGFLYVGSGKGLDRFEPATGHVRHFTAGDGLTPGLLLAGFRDHRGVLWFGTTTGLVRFEPGADVAPPGAASSQNPRTLISAVRVAGIPQLVSALGDLSIVLPDLPPDHNQVEAEFFAFGLAAGEVLRYQYKLAGTMADWSEPSLLRSVNLASLASGRYTFLVRAVNSEGRVSDEPASLTFTILGPIWTRWWFLALATGSVAAILFALYRYRIARVLELAAIRTRIATDLHDDIGANLTRIGLLSEVARQGRDDDRLTSIGNIARESVSAMSDIVWTINPRHESLADVIRRMRRHGEDLFTQRDIDLRFNVQDAHDSLRLSMDVRRDLLLIFKEAVNNTARHAHCTRVSIDLYRRGSRLIFSISDNGVGFDASREHAGQGLTSLRRRTERLKGAMDVQSIPGRGTTLTLQIPI